MKIIDERERLKRQRKKQRGNISYSERVTAKKRGRAFKFNMKISFNL